MVHWKDLGPDERELLADMVEGRHCRATDERLAKLEGRGLIELTAKGSWRVTAAGRSVYVVRDERRPVHPKEER
jgi:hypothetical protein